MSETREGGRGHIGLGRVREAIELECSEPVQCVLVNDPQGVDGDELARPWWA